MPIVFVHGVAVRDEPGWASVQQINRLPPWSAIEGSLRRWVAPAIAAQPETTPILRAYWGDLGARLAYDGVCRPDATTPAEQLRTQVRRPLGEFVTAFFGDVLWYVAQRGDADAPGPIPTRVLETLIAARASAPKDEPLVVLSHSMGGQIVYDLITHFLPQRPDLADLRIDFWCAAASQVGFFAELGLFLEGPPDPPEPHPFPSPAHLGAWWNAWDHKDLLSYRVSGIFDGVDDTPYASRGTSWNEHNRYLYEAAFFQEMARRVIAALAQPAGRDGAPS